MKAEAGDSLKPLLPLVMAMSAARDCTNGQDANITGSDFKGGMGLPEMGVWMGCRLSNLLAQVGWDGEGCGAVRCGAVLCDGMRCSGCGRPAHDRVDPRGAFGRRPAAGSEYPFAHSGAASVMRWEGGDETGWDVGRTMKKMSTKRSKSIVGGFSHTPMLPGRHGRCEAALKTGGVTVGPSG